MDIGYFYVGQIPARPMLITVLDSNNLPVPLASYEKLNLKMLDTDNREIDTSDFEIGPGSSMTGRVTIGWPETYSVFKRPGEYVMQLEMVTISGKVDYTTERTIVVKKLGGKK